MDGHVTFIAAAIAALAAENVVFTRALGLDKQVLFLKSPRMGILYGGVFTIMVTLCSMGAVGINWILLDFTYASLVRALAYLLFTSLVYLTFYYACDWLFASPQNRATVRRVLPVTTFNTALFGVLQLSYTRSYTLLRALGYALGTGVGFTLAILVIYLARKRLAVSPVPRSFRGLPILLVYIGLLSLAIYGLTGHNLPT